jgi:hypothetical protein
MDIISRGSTALIKRYKPDIVIKCSHLRPNHDNTNYVEIEKQIFEILESHARIIK